MSFFELAPRPSFNHARRSFVGQSGALLSAGALMMLAGCRSSVAANKKSNAATDADILNSALAAEHEGVAAYQVGAESGLLQKPVLDLAVQFQGHHKAHADLLAATVRKLGGNPVAPQSAYQFPVEQLKSQADVLRFARDLEAGAVTAYLGAVPVLDNRELARAAASILGDEAMHLAVLRQALGENPVPSAFVG
jgi:rubrerythrin